jgi:hypothetical protein
MTVTQKAIDYFGTQAELSRQLNKKSPQVVNEWTKPGKDMPDYDKLLCAHLMRIKPSELDPVLSVFDKPNWI